MNSYSIKIKNTYIVEVETLKKYFVLRGKYGYIYQVVLIELNIIYIAAQQLIHLFIIHNILRKLEYEINSCITSDIRFIRNLNWIFF